MSAPAAVLAVTFVSRLGQNVMQLTYPLLGAHYLLFGPESLGATVAAAGLVSVIASVGLAGRGRTSRAALVACFGSVGLAAAALGFADARSGALFVLSALVAGAGGGAVFPSLVALTVGHEAKSRSKATARYTAVLALALVVGPLVESALLSLLGASVREVFLALAPVFVLSAIIAAFLYGRVSRPVLLRRASSGAAPPDAGAAVSGHPPADGTPGALGDIRAVLRSPSCRTALMVQGGFEAGFVVVLTFGAVLATEREHFSSAVATALFAMLFATSLGVRSSFALRFPMHWRRHVGAGAMAATVAGLALLDLGGRPAFVLAMFLVGLGHGASYPVSLSFTAEGLPMRLVLPASGLMAATLGLVGTVFPALFGVLDSRLGERLAFSVVAVAVLCAAVTAWRESARVDVPARAREIVP